MAVATFGESYSPLPVGGFTGLPRTRTRNVGPEFSLDYGDSSPSSSGTVVIDPEILGSPWHEGVGGKARKAADRLVDVLSPFNTQDGRVTGLRTGKVAGVGAILSLLAAANELNDPNESAGRNLAQAAGVGAGGIGGSLLGGLGGRALGGAVAGAAGGGPIGALIGATLGGIVGSDAGRGLASFAADLVQGSPESRAIRNQQAMARAAAESEAERLRMLMPLQDQAAQIAVRNRASMAEIENEQMMRQAIAQSLLAQQQGGTAQALAMTNAILGA